MSRPARRRPHIAAYATTLSVFTQSVKRLCRHRSGTLQYRVKLLVTLLPGTFSGGRLKFAPRLACGRGFTRNATPVLSRIFQIKSPPHTHARRDSCHLPRGTKTAYAPATPQKHHHIEHVYALFAYCISPISTPSTPTNRSHNGGRLIAAVNPPLNPTASSLMNIGTNQPPATRPQVLHPNMILST